MTFFLAGKKGYTRCSHLNVPKSRHSRLSGWRSPPAHEGSHGGAPPLVVVICRSPSVWRTEVVSPAHVTNPLWSPLRHQRKLRGWSQQDLVDELCKLCYEDERKPGLNVKTIGRWEKGENKPSPFYCKRLCQLFGMTAEELGLL